MNSLQALLQRRAFTPYYRRRFYYAGKRLLVKGKITVLGKVVVGNGVVFEPNSFLFASDNGLIKLGNNIYFNRGIVSSTAKVEIGNNVVISQDALILDHNGFGLDGHPPISEPIKIGNHVWIGTRATVLKGVIIGDNSIVGAGAVVTKDVEPNTLVAGNPAQKIRNTEGFTLF